MNPSKKNTEQSIKDKFLQHEFGLDAGMWDDMEQKLDRRDNIGGSDRSSNPGKGFWNGFRKGWALLAVLVLIVFSGLFWWNHSVSNNFSEHQLSKQDQSSTLSISKEANQESANTSQANKSNNKNQDLNKALIDEKADSPDFSKNSDSNESRLTKQANNNFNKAKITKSSQSKAGSISNRKRKQGQPLDLRSKEDVPLSSSPPTLSELQNGQNHNSVVEKGFNNALMIDSTSDSQALNASFPNTSKKQKNSAKDSDLLRSEEVLKEAIDVLETPYEVLETQDRDEAETLKKWWRSQPKFINRASPFQFGVKAGILIPQINGSNNLNTGQQISWENKSAFYIQAAGIYQLNKKVSLEIGLKYSKIPYFFNLDYTDLNSNLIFDKTEQSIRQLSLPLIVNLSLNKNISLSAGLGKTFRKVNSPFEKLFGDENIDKLYKITNNLYKPTRSFWQAGIELNHARWSVGLDYQHFFGSTTTDFDLEGEHYDTYTKEWNINASLAYSINPKRKIALAKLHEDKKVKRLFWGTGFALGRSAFSSSNSVVDLNLLVWDDFATYKINLFSYFRLNHRFRLQTGLWYNKNNLAYELDPSLSSDPFYASDQLEINSLEVPLTLHFRVASNFRIVGGAGLQYNFVKQPKIITYPTNPEFASFYNSIPGRFKKQYPFYDIGIGFDWKQFALDLRFRTMIGDFIEGIPYEEINYKAPGDASQWFLGCSYTFGRN